MANTIKELSAGDITRKALSILHNNLVFVKTINREYDDRFARSGAKNGGTLLIREPNQFTVRSGAIMDTQDVTERTQTLTLATQRGVDINFSSVELTLSLDDFADRILKPAMARLAAEVDKLVIAGCYPYVYNCLHTTFGTAPTLAEVLKVRARLQQGLAPTGNRTLMTDATTANGIITAGYNIYNPSSEISRQYEQGMLGTVYGFEHRETEMATTHTTGSRNDTTPTVSTITGIVSGTATITVSGQSDAQTWTVGDVFTVAGVYAVNPETKAVYGHLQQWTVLSAGTVSSTAVTLSVAPTPYKSGPFQNISVVTSSTTASVVATSANTSGSASSTYYNSIGYHRDAFTFVTADLEMPKGVDFAAREVYDGISLRVVRKYDIVNDKFPCRIDVLFGYKTIRPEWACRLTW